MDIRQFYYDGIMPSEIDNPSASFEYRHELEKLQEYEKLLLLKADSEMQSTYQKMKETLANISTMEASHTFRLGFRIGGQLAIEILRDA